MKRYNLADSRSGGQRVRTFGKCNKVHEGVCRFSLGFHKCDRESHIVRDCRQQALILSSKISYYCDQVGRVKVNYPLLAVIPVQAPSPTTLRITDGRQGRAEPPRARGTAFQLTIEEPRVELDVVTSMFSFIILLGYFIIRLCI